MGLRWKDEVPKGCLGGALVISSPSELEVALSQLDTFQEMLETMRQRLSASRPGLFPQMAEGYLVRIRSLESDVIAYLRERPAAAPLTVRIAGPEIHAGTIRATLAVQLISGLQSALYQIGGLYGGPPEATAREREGTGLRALLGLNLVATAPGSFILSMDLAPRQLKLFHEYDTAAEALTKLIGHVNELQESPEAFSGQRPTLRGIRKLSTLAKRGVEVITLKYDEEDRHAQADVTPLINERVEFLLGAPAVGERTVVGQLIQINVEDNSCVIHPDDAPRITCDYEENLEDDLMAALRKRIEMAGQFVSLERQQDRYRITKIERFRILDEESPTG